MITSSFYARCDGCDPVYANDPDGELCEAEFEITVDSLDSQDFLRQFFARGWVIRLETGRNTHYCPKHAQAGEDRAQ